MKNIDFKKWYWTAANQVLWLSGPSHRGMSEITVYTLGTVRPAAQAEGLVLYFFMNETVLKGATEAFPHTLLQHLINQSPEETSEKVAVRFICGLQCQSWKRNPFTVQRQHSIIQMLREMLEVAKTTEVWRAFAEYYEQTEKPILCTVTEFKWARGKAWSRDTFAS